MRRIKLQENSITSNNTVDNNGNKSLKQISKKIYLQKHANKMYLCIHNPLNNQLCVQRYTSFMGKLLYNCTQIKEQDITMCELPLQEDIYIRLQQEETVTFYKIMSINQNSEHSEIYNLYQKPNDKICIFNVNSQSKMYANIKLENVNNVFKFTNINNVKILSDSRVYLTQKSEIITESDNFYHNHENQLCVDINLFKYYTNEKCELHFHLFYLYKQNIIHTTLSYPIAIEMHSIINYFYKH